MKRACRYVDMSETAFLELGLPWIDMRKPGRERAVRRWDVTDLDSFIEARRVNALPRP